MYHQSVATGARSLWTPVFTNVAQTGGVTAPRVRNSAASDGRSNEGGTSFGWVMECRGHPAHLFKVRAVHVADRRIRGPRGLGRSQSAKGADESAAVLTSAPVLPTLRSDRSLSAIHDHLGDPALGRRLPAVWGFPESAPGDRRKNGGAAAGGDLPRRRV